MPVARGLRVVGGFFADLFSFVNDEPDLVIDMKRVNLELRREGLLGFEDDVVYRNRVKQRIREGKGCAYPPLIDRKKVLQFAALARGEGRSSANGKSASDSIAQAG